MTRPMDFFDEMLPRLGVEVVSNHGRLPLRINGPLQPQNIEMDGSLSSQFLTGLIYAFAASDVEDVTIRVHQLKSKPYIDLTLKVLSAFGLRVPQNRHYESFHFGTLPAGGSAPVHYRVEGDWSGGAFLLVAGAIGGHVTVSGLDTGSVQADRRILQALVDAGCDIRTSQNEICLSDPLVAGRPFEFDATDCPDLFPPLVALAAYCQGTTSLRGTSRLAHKESNRALTLQEEFAKLGVEIDLKGDQMLIRGGSGVRSATVRSHHDHRIAMACTVTALKAQGAVTLEEAEAVDKSYPDFYGHLKYLGAQLTDDRVTNHQNHTL
jgi:3-phosphoshikimate 1-carboxyvinyltransferase